MTIPIAQVLTDLEDLQARVKLDPTYAPEHIAALALGYSDMLERDTRDLEGLTTTRQCSLCGRPLIDDLDGPWCWECAHPEGGMPPL